MIWMAVFYFVIALIFSIVSLFAFESREQALNNALGVVFFSLIWPWVVLNFLVNEALRIATPSNKTEGTGAGGILRGHESDAQKKSKSNRKLTNRFTA